MRFGFSIKLAPGVRVGVSTGRRVRTRAWVSEGRGGFRMSQSVRVSGKRRRRSR